MMWEEIQTHKSMKQIKHKYAKHFLAKSQEQWNVGRIAFSTMVLEQLDTEEKKKNFKLNII